MFKEQVSLKAREEFNDKTWGVTQQFLQVHNLVLVDGQPKIDRIDTDKSDGSVIAYLPVKGESFHFAITFDNKENLDIIGIGTEPYSSVSFRATSEELTLDELTSLTIITPTDGWNKGDKKKFGTGIYKFNSIVIEPNPESDEFEDKMNKLLDFLEQDKVGIRRLCETANGYIQVGMKFHNGNTMLGGPHLDNVIVKRLNNLSLSIDFDLYADGNLFKEE